MEYKKIGETYYVIYLYRFGKKCFVDFQAFFMYNNHRKLLLPGCWLLFSGRKLIR